MFMTASIYLVKGREKSLRRRHPWVFSRGIDRIEGKPGLGETVDIYDNTIFDSRYRIHAS